MTMSHTGDLPAGWVPGVGHGFGYEVVRNTAGMFRYNSIGTFVKGGAYRTYEWVDGRKGLVGIVMMQRTNGGGDVADEINSVMQISSATISSDSH
jgi:CubicO group peptidase (beta-lactamase class C family)